MQLLRRLFHTKHCCTLMLTSNKIRMDNNNQDSLVLPYESSAFVMKHAKHTKICENGVNKLAQMIYDYLNNDKKCNYFNFKSFDLNPQEMNENAINWIFVVDTLNFSFWNVPDKENHLNTDYHYRVNYKNKSYSGYWALCAAINRAIDEGYQITNPEYYSKISEKDLRHILRSDSWFQIPLFNERLRYLRESGTILLEKFQGNFTNCIKLANSNAKQLLKLIVNNFPSFRDEAVYMGRKVTFYKRAQILVADLWACFEGEGYGKFDDIDEITMFADYRVPQMLRFYGAIEYSPELDAHIECDKLMNSGDQFEIEIRAASIYSCREISNKVVELLKVKPIENVEFKTSGVINDILVDYYLWNYRVEHAKEIDSASKFHKIRCIYY